MTPEERDQLKPDVVVDDKKIAELVSEIDTLAEQIESPEEVEAWETLRKLKKRNTKQSHRRRAGCGG